MTVKNQTLGKIPFIIFLGLVSSGGPIATDVFMPALPDMPEALGVSAALVNLTITVFFFTQALGMLLVGPLSDRIGRKKPLTVCITLFSACSFVCAAANNVWVMIAARAVQGFCGGGMASLATALVKECFEGKDRQNALLAVQALITCTPLIAPVLGSFLLMFVSWRGTFIAQAIIGLATVPALLRLKETLPPEERTTGGGLDTFTGLFGLLKNKTIIMAVLASSLMSLAMLSYVTINSYIYIDFFQLDKMSFSLFFGTNAGLSALFTACVPKLLKHVDGRKLFTFALCVAPLAALACIFIGGVSPWAFYFCILFMVAVPGAIRPVAINLVLDMHEGDTGSLASLINFSFSMIGCLGSLAISQDWPTYIIGVGVIAFLAHGASLVCWLTLRKSGRI